ncbi:hypothetical protein EDD18DRAFT_1336564 [Armillaria luteobubalina]|uniref:Uncharacterized protein n=1 Tax=Armillaria luteobubalina TaxID=153913 RepID=A0AA39PE71_9AGAR|nr:hypothetical protein EDD18DRAFT_1336564 [Armillaria luteobubalina]
MSVAGAVLLSDGPVSWEDLKGMHVPLRRLDCIVDVGVDFGAKVHSRRQRMPILVFIMLPGDYEHSPFLLQTQRRLSSTHTAFAAVYTAVDTRRYANHQFCSLHTGRLLALVTTHYSTTRGAFAAVYTAVQPLTDTMENVFTVAVFFVLNPTLPLSNENDGFSWLPVFNLHGRYFEYASLLASQGLVEEATVLLKLTPGDSRGPRSAIRESLFRMKFEPTGTNTIKIDRKALPPQPSLPTAHFSVCAWRTMFSSSSSYVSSVCSASIQHWSASSCVQYPNQGQPLMQLPHLCAALSACQTPAPGQPPPKRTENGTWNDGHVDYFVTSSTTDAQSICSSSTTNASGTVWMSTTPASSSTYRTVPYAHALPTPGQASPYRPVKVESYSPAYGGAQRQQRRPPPAGPMVSLPPPSSTSSSSCGKGASCPNISSSCHDGWLYGSGSRRSQLAPLSLAHSYLEASIISSDTSHSTLTVIDVHAFFVAKAPLVEERMIYERRLPRNKGMRTDIWTEVLSRQSRRTRCVLPAHSSFEAIGGERRHGGGLFKELEMFKVGTVHLPVRRRHFLFGRDNIISGESERARLPGDVGGGRLNAVRPLETATLLDLDWRLTAERRETFYELTLVLSYSWTWTRRILDTDPRLEQAVTIVNASSVMDDEGVRMAWMFLLMPNVVVLMERECSETISARIGNTRVQLAERGRLFYERLALLRLVPDPSSSCIRRGE